jgi:transposase
MEYSLNTPGSKKNGVLPVPPVLPDAERREAERSEADRSAASGKTVAPAGAGHPDPEVPPDAKRRRFTAEYKLEILAQADAAKNNSGAIGALLRREGLYSSHLVSWRKERDAAIRKGLAPKTRGPKPKITSEHEELERLRRENASLTDALAKAELIIDVQKKVGSLLGWNLPKPDQEGNS